MRRFLILLVMFVIPSASRAQEAAWPDVLAFSLISSPGVYPTSNTYENNYDYVETIYLYQPESDTLQVIGTGDSIRWSPHGRFLAMVDTINEDPIAGKYSGKIRHFSIRDFETSMTFIRDYAVGDYVTWSPDEQYLIAGGSVSSGVGGANAWVDIFHGNGSGQPPEMHVGYVDGLMGTRGGVFLAGWVPDDAQGKVLVRDIGVQRDDYVLIDPDTRERTVVSGDLPVYVNLANWEFGSVGIAKSPDNRYAAVTHAKRLWEVGADFTTYLMIVDMQTGETHRVDLPVSTSVVIAHMAWRPCDPNVINPDCYL